MFEFMYMRRCLRYVVFIGIIIAILSSFAKAEERSYYDRNGSFAGSSVSGGNKSSYTDRNGSFAGSAVRNSNGTTSVYDRNGHFTGSSVTTKGERR
jgi:hypothetical protein